MVGLVIVSHSRKLAEALVNLVRQMAAPEVKIAIAAGVGEAREEFGTDAVEISEAIQAVSSPDCSASKPSMARPVPKQPSHQPCLLL